jgi:hypothetical protein
MRSHVNAPGVLVQDLLGKTSIYGAPSASVKRNHAPRPLRALWHQRGGGNAGAVPVVLNTSTPPRSCTQGVSGEHFNDVADLASRTAALIANPVRCPLMAVAATERAEYFGYDAFQPRLFSLVESL